MRLKISCGSVACGARPQFRTFPLCEIEYKNGKVPSVGTRGRLAATGFSVAATYNPDRKHSMPAPTARSERNLQDAFRVANSKEGSAVERGRSPLAVDLESKNGRDGSSDQLNIRRSVI